MNFLKMKNFLKMNRNSTEQFASLVGGWINCQRCPLSQLRTKVVFGHGNLSARLAMIGEAPGKNEDLLGEPFVGVAGKQFNALLSAVGIDRNDIWVTNTCLCRPKSTKPGKENRPPTVKEIRACEARLLDELDIIRPEIIVLAGNTPLFLATKRRGITKYRGWQDTEWVGQGWGTKKVYATLHPASLLYGSIDQRKKKRAWIFEDWLAIAEALGVKKEEGTTK